MDEETGRTALPARQLRAASHDLDIADIAEQAITIRQVEKLLYCFH